MFQYIDGEYAFVMEIGNTLLIARDHMGIRSLYVGYDENNKLVAVASEGKAIHDICGITYVKQFPPGCFYIKTEGEEQCAHHWIPKELNYTLPEQCIVPMLEKSVKDRLVSDRPVGVLLSGGLDSSLVAAIAAKYNKNIDTFSIGFKNSPDLKWARKVANHIGSKHHEFIITEKQAYVMISDTIYRLETCDLTTIRAGTMMNMLGYFIHQCTDTKVVLSGEGADELFGGYMYFHYAPNDIEFHLECKRLLTQLYKYDILRSDKSISGHNIEIRSPFLQKDFIRAYLSIDVKLRNPTYSGIEKNLIRQLFSHYLPHDILYRPKEAFSDGVGHSWKDCVNEEYVKHEYNRLYPKIKPYKKWMPRSDWSDELSNLTDPSAVVLNKYRKDNVA